MKHLYKLRIDGKIQRTTVEISGSHYRTITCQYNEGSTDKLDQIESSKVISSTTRATPKNVGRSNETTAEEQAALEVQSKIDKMLDNGYVADIKDVNNPRIKKYAMLAPSKGVDWEKTERELNTGESYEVKKGDRKKGIPDRIAKGYVYVQPKLDGVRCIATSAGLFRRSGKRIVSVPHIDEELQYLFDKYPSIILDGELYNHDLADDFDEIISIARKEKVKNIDPEKAKKIQYHIYDEVSPEMFKDRILINIQTESVRTVETKKCTDLTAISALHEQWLSQGYEGTMIRFDAPYQVNERNYMLQKLKEFIEEEFPIIGIEDGDKGKAVGLACKIVVDVNGVKVKATMMGSEGYRQQIWDEAEDYIGGQATVKYFNKTKDGSLRFPNCKAVFKQQRDI